MHATETLLGKGGGRVANQGYAWKKYGFRLGSGRRRRRIAARADQEGGPWKYVNRALGAEKEGSHTAAWHCGGPVTEDERKNFVAHFAPEPYRLEGGGG